MAIGDCYEFPASFGSSSTQGPTRKISVSIEADQMTPDEAFNAFCGRHVSVKLLAEIASVGRDSLPGQMTLPDIELPPPERLELISEANISSFSMKKSGITFSLQMNRKDVEDGELDRFVKQMGRVSLEVLGDCSGDEDAPPTSVGAGVSKPASVPAEVVAPVCDPVDGDVGGAYPLAVLAKDELKKVLNRPVHAVEVIPLRSIAKIGKEFSVSTISGLEGVMLMHRDLITSLVGEDVSRRIVSALDAFRTKFPATGMPADYESEEYQSGYQAGLHGSDDVCMYGEPEQVRLFNLGLQAGQRKRGEQERDYGTIFE